MLEKYYIKPQTLDRIRGHWLGEPIERYVTWLHDQNYRARNVLRRVPLLLHFGTHAQSQGAKTWTDLPQHVPGFVHDWTAEHGGRCRTERARKSVANGVRGPIEQMLRLVLPDLVSPKIELPPIAGGVSQALGGGPRHVRDGRFAGSPDPGIYPAGFADARHPRTAVGVRADGRILLVAVDGRQPELSVGMTIAELAALLLELGAVEAVNMDGRGSTTMVVRDRVVNSPSDLTGERAVGDALLVFLR